jgi:hypothetical protein
MIRRVLLTLVMIAVALVALLVADAEAACATSPGSTSVSARGPFGALPGVPLGVAPVPSLVSTSPAQALKVASPNNNTGSSAIVGLWFTVFKVGDAVWNRGFQQYHAGGTELSVDSSVPPVLGNVCIGVWKMTGPHTFKLRHVTWNWNPDGSPAGTFLLITTVRLNPHSDTYEGTFESDSFDTNNVVIPEFHAEGTVTGRRITVD